MGRIPLFDRWFGRIANAATFWQFAPPGFFALIGGYLAWFSHFSALVWFASGVVTFVVTAFGFGVIARTKLWRLDAKHRERVGGDSSAFDPMAKVHQNKRLFLRDLAPLGRQIVSDKKFINCEIIGPGNVIAAVRSKDTLPFPTFKNNRFNDVDCVQIVPDKPSNNAIYFFDCDFDGCQFYTLNLLFYNRLDESWSWITPPPDPSPALLPSPKPVTAARTRRAKQP